MNKKRREDLGVALGMLSEARKLVSRAKDGEQDALDNTPENMQGGERYEKKEASVDALEEAESLIEEAIEQIGNARV